jgi:hypothetical protein
MASPMKPASHPRVDSGAARRMAGHVAAGVPGRAGGPGVRSPASVPPPPAPRTIAPGGPAEPPGPAFHSGHDAGHSSSTSRWYLLAAILVVAIAAVTVGFAFGEAPVPPGVDPGHWLSISYSYVGLPTAPDPTDRPFFYSPGLFPILGGLVVLTGNPLIAASATAVLLFLCYGLSVVHLARRFLVAGPLQVALAGLAAFSGTTIQMVFWGGYPNLLGFIVMNEALVFLIAFVRTSRERDGVVFFALLGLCYFSHDLSFAVLLTSVVTIALFLLLLGKIHWRFLIQRVTILGTVAVAGAIEGYSVLTSHLGIPHPSYFHSNPAAFMIDNVGELFAPLAHAPAFIPPGPLVDLPPLRTALLLASAPLVALIALWIAARIVRRRVDTPLVTAGAWLAAALAVPGIGYLAHVETDYTRFLYFLPLPFVLVLLLAVERAFFLRPARTLAALPAPSARESRTRRSGPTVLRGRSRRTVVADLSVAAVLTVIFLTVTAPLAFANERAGTLIAHDQLFLNAVGWLKSSPDPGSVLTTSSAARWTEGLADRNSFDVGPVWLLFDPFQISDAQESYWALNSQYAITNNQVALSFSGFAAPVLSQAPTYTAYIDGVPFPVVRVVPGTLAVNATGITGNTTYDLDGAMPPTLDAPVGGTDTATYQSQGASLVEVAEVLPDGSAAITFTVTPVPGESVHSLAFTLAAPPSDSTTLATDKYGGYQYSDGTLDWWVSGKLGQYPVRQNVTTTVNFSTDPSLSPAPALTGVRSVGLTFADPNGSRPFVVTLHLATPGASNPTKELPSALPTTSFLSANGIHFLLWRSTPDGWVELYYYEATFGFREVFTNAEWAILEG